MRKLSSPAERIHRLTRGRRVSSAMAGRYHVDDLSSGKRENIPEKAEFRDRRELAVCSSRFVRQTSMSSLTSPRDSVRRASPTHRRRHTTSSAHSACWRAAECGAQRGRFHFDGGALYGDFNTPPNYETYPKDPSPPTRSPSWRGVLPRLYSRVHGREYAAVRFANGDVEQDPMVRPALSRSSAGGFSTTAATVFGDGLQTRDYVYVRDVARAVWLAATKPLPRRDGSMRGVQLEPEGTSVTRSRALQRRPAASPIEFAPHRR